MEFSKILDSIKHIFFIFIVLWGIFSLLNLLHKGISILWRILVLIIFLMFTFFHFSIIFDLYRMIFNEPMLFLKNILLELVLIISHFDIVLYLLWPILLIYSFFSAREKKSIEYIKFLITITLMFWIIYFVRENSKIHEIWNQFISEKLSHLFQ